MDVSTEIQYICQPERRMKTYTSPEYENFTFIDKSARLHSQFIDVSRYYN